MSRFSFLLALAVVVALFAVTCDAAIKLPTFISNGMVLQRGRPTRIWGTATAGQVITATLSGNRYTSTSNADGVFDIVLPPHEAAFNLQIGLSGDGSTITLANVAYGDVYFCSGQSNMELDVAGTYNATTEIANSVNYVHLRLFSVAKNASTEPLYDVTSRFPTGGWQQSNPTSVGGAAPFDYFSATCYYTGRDIYNFLNRNSTVPVGLIESCWGGTRIEAWASPEGNARCGPPTPPEEFEAMEESLAKRSDDYETTRYRSVWWKKEAERNLPGQVNPQTASALYNAMVHPFLRYAFIGSLWYQGEANSGNATNYACRFPVMIEDWRFHMENFEMAFDFVLLAPYVDDSYPALREAQLRALFVPNVGVSNVLDWGDLASPYGSIHPRGKQAVGSRLARGILRRVYRQEEIISFGPLLDGVEWPNARHNNTIILHHDVALRQNAGLYLKETEQCTACCTLNTTNSAFHIITASANRTLEYLAAEVTIDRATGEVTLGLSHIPEGEVVVGVNHAYQAYPQCILASEVGLVGLPYNFTRPRAEWEAELKRINSE